MNRQKTSKKKLSIQLLVVLVPMIAAFIIVVAVIIFTNSKSIITQQGKDGLEKESKANANDIARTMMEMKGYYDSLADTLEAVDLKNTAAIKEALQPGMKRYPDVVHDVYVALPDKTFIDGGDWVPASDYDPTTRGWYQTGIKSDELVFGSPDIDMDTKEAVVNGISAVHFKNGVTGVLSTDFFLKGISQDVSLYTPLGTGKSMLFAGPTIIGAPEPEYVGADATTLTNDSFVQAIYQDVSAKKTGQVSTIRGNDNQQYFVSYEAVGGTDWILVSYVKKNDVLKQLNSLSLITIILVIAMLVISTIIILFLVKKMITNPVNDLTHTITRISEGDFTVSINKGGTNEIGTMNNRMYDYVERMRSTLGEMKNVTNLLSTEADNSRQASNTLNIQAEEQSHSMTQIHEAMEGVASSVVELATNATELAQSVGDMMEQGNDTNSTMAELVEKAKKGQSDMDNVQRNMDGISKTMTEMSEVVSRVSDATKQINSIIDMINAISAQTNLLSLNASIEAARAGEAGRGFAVVADEIGALAAESSKATTEIAQIITEVTKQIDALSERSAQSVNEIVASGEAVSATGETFADIFEELNKAGSTVQDMIGQMEKVNNIATSVAAIAEEQSASTEEVTATVDTAASSAQNVAEESRGVDESAVTVADSAAKIGEFVDTFTI